MSTDELIAGTLMIMCFIPVIIYLAWIGFDFAKRLWSIQQYRYKKLVIFRRIQRDSRIPNYRENTRVLR